MLAVQMVATHEAALAMFNIAKSNSTVPTIQAAGGLAVRLLRTHTAQIEASQNTPRRRADRPVGVVLGLRADSKRKGRLMTALVQWEERLTK